MLYCELLSTYSKTNTETTTRMLAMRLDQKKFIKDVHTLSRVNLIATNITNNWQKTAPSNATFQTWFKATGE